VRQGDLPFVEGIVSADEMVATVDSLAAMQERSGAIPWYVGDTHDSPGWVDAWNHTECAMALAVGGRLEEARRAYDWLLATQRRDGSWPMKTVKGVVEDPSADTNQCAYIAVGTWHHWLLTRDEAFVLRMWPAVCRAIDFVTSLQTARGEISWNVDGETGRPGVYALLTGCSSTYHSLRAALALAELVDAPQPDWELAAGRLAHVVAEHPEAFEPKNEFAMDWYYPVLGGAVRGAAARHRLAERWDDFVVPGLGCRCVDNRPWVTGAETCELVLSLDAIGDRGRALEQFAAMQHLRDASGGYWTGLVYDEKVRWPGGLSSWTSATVILAADALSGTTPGAETFRAEDLPTGVDLEATACGCDAWLPSDAVADPL
jgi:hypothetical protein